MKRACIRCVWWKRGTKLLEGEDPLATEWESDPQDGLVRRYPVEGVCRRFPKWESVTAAHYCGEFKHDSLLYSYGC